MTAEHSTWCQGNPERVAGTEQGFGVESAIERGSSIAQPVLSLALWVWCLVIQCNLLCVLEHATLPRDDPYSYTHTPLSTIGHKACESLPFALVFRYPRSVHRPWASKRPWGIWLCLLEDQSCFWGKSLLPWAISGMGTSLERWCTGNRRWQDYLERLPGYLPFLCHLISHPRLGASEQWQEP